MKVLIDADACPVVDMAVGLCAEFTVECILFCDTAHQMQRPGARTLIFDKGADSVDFALVNQAEKGDVVVTSVIPTANIILSTRREIFNANSSETACSP